MESEDEDGLVKYDDDSNVFLLWNLQLLIFFQ